MFHKLCRQLQRNEFEEESITHFDYNECKSDDGGDQGPVDNVFDRKVQPSSVKRLKSDKGDDAKVGISGCFSQTTPFFSLKKRAKPWVQWLVISIYI